MEPDLLKILIERTSYINTYWNFYIVVATAIVGTLASGKITINRNIRIIFTVAFVLFAQSNCAAIKDINEQRTAILDQISVDNIEKIVSGKVTTGRNDKERIAIIAREFKPNPKLVYLLFHFLLDITVLVAIWRITPNNDKL